MREQLICSPSAHTCQHGRTNTHTRIKTCLACSRLAQLRKQYVQSFFIRVQVNPYNKCTMHRKPRGKRDVSRSLCKTQEPWRSRVPACVIHSLLEWVAAEMERRKKKAGKMFAAAQWDWECEGVGGLSGWTGTWDEFGRREDGRGSEEGELIWNGKEGFIMWRSWWEMKNWEVWLCAVYILPQFSQKWLSWWGKWFLVQSDDKNKWMNITCLITWNHVKMERSHLMQHYDIMAWA